jgi:hypothetical protein
VAPTAHQIVGPTTFRRNSASLEGHDTALANLRLARWLDAPSGEVPPRSRAGQPPRARSRLARGLDTPSSEVPPRSRTSWARCLHTCSPTGAFNALTFAGAQVKDEYTPRRTWESRPGAVPPTPPVRPSPPLCDAVRHGRCQSRDTVPPTLVRLMRRALERGRQNPRRGGGGRTSIPRLPRTTPWRQASGTGHLRRRRSYAAILAVPTPSRALHRHPLCCAGTGWQDAATPAVVRPTDSCQPHPRVGVRTTTLRRTSTLPPSKPLLGGHRARHDAPPEARFARTVVHSVVLCTIPPHVARTVRHACKLPPPWPIKGGASPLPQGDDRGHSPHTFCLHHDIGTYLIQYLWDLEARPPLPPRL